MKRYIALILLSFLLPRLANAQAAEYRVVFDLTSKDTMNHKAVLHWVHEIVDNNPAAKVEVVLYGLSLDLVTKGKSVAEQEVQKLTADKKAAFKVCAIAMKAHDVEKSMLIPGVEIVPDGIYEIVSRQHDGWAYIKGIR